MGWGGFLDKLLEKLPIQGRVERWKNELETLTKEREKLLQGACDEKKAARLEWVDNRIVTLNQLLKNKAGN